MKTSQRQTLQDTGDGLMSSQGDSPVSLFPMQESGGGQTDDRYLWPEMLRVIDEVRPTWVVGENVAGITTMVESCEVTYMGGETSLFEEDGGVHRFQSEHTFTVERICRDLESKGYSVQPVLIPACAVGAPHRRDRVFIIAYSAGCRSESYSQNGGTEGNGCRKYAQQGEWSEQAEFDNRLSALSRPTSDPNNDPDVRKSGKYEGESGEEWLQERNEIQFAGESSDVRSETAGTSSDSDCNGGNEVHKHIQSELADGTESVCNGRKQNASDSKGQRGGADDGAWREEQEQSGRVGGESIARMLPRERWKGFPSVSPVHRGNDGLPFDVDNLTISFAKWRNESLKAYGNAIVPQVMYRIFQCIEYTKL